MHYCVHNIFKKVRKSFAKNCCFENLWRLLCSPISTTGCVQNSFFFKLFIFNVFTTKLTTSLSNLFIVTDRYFLRGSLFISFRPMTKHSEMITSFNSQRICLCDSFNSFKHIAYSFTTLFMFIYSYN